MTPARLLLVAALLSAAPARASFINYSSREINVKIVYYGPASVGQLENLQYIYSKTNPEAKGKMISLATDSPGDRTLFFDFLPLALGKIRGFQVRIHLYTSPTKDEYTASRKLILKGADAVVFIADSDPAQKSATLASWHGLLKNLREQGYAPEKMPLVVQLDHRTHPQALPVATVRTLLNLPPEVQLFEADPRTGFGVFDTLKAITKLVLLELKNGASK